MEIQSVLWSEVTFILPHPSHARLQYYIVSREGWSLWKQFPESLWLFRKWTWGQAVFVKGNGNSIAQSFQHFQDNAGCSSAVNRMKSPGRAQ